MQHCRLYLGAAVMVAACLAAALPGNAQTASDSCAITTKERVVAVGDVHGAYDQFVAILRAAGLIDDRERWSGGRAVLVQTGDVPDRGPDSRRALDLLRRLEREAKSAGGQVHALLGNHEVMRIVGDFRYVSAEEYAAFRGVASEQLRDRVHEKATDGAAAKAKAAGQRLDEAEFRRQFLQTTPLGAIEMQIEFGPDGEYGRWLLTHDAMVKINGIVFVHGGISPAVASIGCNTVNKTVRAELRVEPTTLKPDALAISETGPLWYRELALQPESTFSNEVDGILKKLDARAIVIGHTVSGSGRIITRFDGRVVEIDTGMLNGKFYPNGRPSALEIEGDKLTAIYETNREVLPLAPAPAALTR